jgi:hypothetical protein
VDTVGEGNTRAGLSHRHIHMHTRISWRRRRLFSVHMISAPRAVQSKRKHQSNSSKTIINNANVSVNRINASRGCWQHLHSRSQPTQTDTHSYPDGNKEEATSAGEHARSHKHAVFVAFSPPLHGLAPNAAAERLLKHLCAREPGSRADSRALQRPRCSCMCKQTYQSPSCSHPQGNTQKHSPLTEAPVFALVRKCGHCHVRASVSAWPTPTSRKSYAWMRKRG